MTNIELAIKHGAEWSTISTGWLLIQPEQLDAYSAELLAQASSEPFCYIHSMFLTRQCLGGEFAFFKPNDSCVPLFKANLLNTEMVETIKRLEEALREAMYSNSTAIAKDKAEKALASISPGIKQQY
jgi:hypothetical protein